jgi:tetratricopeptide (TPR) repeat protein
VFVLKGWLALLKGELREARQALVESQRRAQGEGSEVALSLASLILREEDRPAEARALLERDHQLAISMGEARDDDGQVACRVECDSKKYKEGLACLDEVSRYINYDMDRVQVAVTGGECRLAMGDATGALSALEQVSDVSIFPPMAARRDVLRARAAAQLGHTPVAITQLRGILADAERRLWGGIALEAKLALGEVELQAGRAQGRPRLAKLEEDARSKGFLRIARLAREALDSKAQRPPSP